MADFLLADFLNYLLYDIFIFAAVGSSICGAIYYRFRLSVVTKLTLSVVLFAVLASTFTSLVKYFRFYHPELMVVSYVFVLPVAVVFGVALLLMVYRLIISPMLYVEKLSSNLAKGDFSVATEKVRIGNDEFGHIVTSINELVNYSRPIMTDISVMSSQLSNTADELASSSEELNASFEEITAVVNQISSGAVNQVKLIHEVKATVDRLEEGFMAKSRELQSISALVQGIAQQVNMLALNASIEAARAGEYGRGFAVVAENIRKLADETRSSITVIDSVISDLSTNLVHSIQNITNLVDGVATVSEEAAAGTQEANASAQEQTAMMEELTASAQTLSQYAQLLDDLSKMFKYSAD